MKSQVLSSLSLAHQIQKLEQVCLEDKYSRKNIREKILDDIAQTDVASLDLDGAAEAVQYYLSPIHSTYESLDKAKAFAFNNPDYNVMDIVYEILYCIMPYTYWSPIQATAGQLAQFMGYEDIFAGVKVAADLIAIVSDTDLYDIKTNPMMVKSNYALEPETIEYINNTMYTLPSLSKPRKVTTNNDSGYITQKDSLILGKGNYHEKTLALDAINIANTVKLCLDTDVISEPEQPSSELVEQIQKDNHIQFINECKIVFKELLDSGNEFYLTWKFDKRGRMYSQGYHVNIQSTEYRKAAISLANKEIIG